MWNNNGNAGASWSEPARGIRFTNRELLKLVLLLKSKHSLNRGPKVRNFESKIENYLEVNHAIATTSCSSALFLVPKILGLRKGDEILVPINSFWTSIAPLLALGIKPIPYISSIDLNGDPVDAERKVTKKTRAIYVQSFGGSPFDANVFRSLCDSLRLKLIEDSAHGVGTKFQGKSIQNFSDISCLSFSTLKNIVTLGEGGAVVTNHKEYGERARLLIESRAIGNFVQDIEAKEEQYLRLIEIAGYDFMRTGDAFEGFWSEIDSIGTTLRMSAPQALIGSLQLDRLEEVVEKRREQCRTYHNSLNIIVEGRSRVLENCENSAHHLFNMHINDSNLRNKIIVALKKELNFNVTNRYIPISRHSVSRYYGVPHLKNSLYESLFLNNLLALPIGPNFKRRHQARIIDCINNATKAY
jgi:perosamine synthetase